MDLWSRARSEAARRVEWVVCREGHRQTRRKSDKRHCYSELLTPTCPLQPPETSPHQKKTYNYCQLVVQYLLVASSFGNLEQKTS